MGAVHKFDLTSDVTHLIVGDSDTPKYKFVAREREDVKCLLPSWIDAVRLSWMEGEEADVQALEREHALPIFAGLRICVTGFDDLAYRRQLEDIINTNGGEYRGNLTKDITHLIAKEPSGNKFNYATQWGIKTVSIEWMTDSLARGMILDEASYSLLLPPSDRGRTAWLRRTMSTTSLGKRPPESELGKPNSRKLRRTASAKLSSESSGLWSNIVGESVNEEHARPDEWQDRNDNTAPVKSEGGATAISQTSGEQRSQRDHGLRPDTNYDPHRPTHRGGIFRGKKFILHGYTEKKTNVLQRHLLSHDAVILTDTSFLPDRISEDCAEDYLLLVPHAMCRNELPTSHESLQRPTAVTDLWLERCLYNKQLISPSAHILNTPFFDAPIEGFGDFTIAATGFHDYDLLHLSKVVVLIGAKFGEDLTFDTSVLICKEVAQTSSKPSFARDHGIPAVTADWLWDCISKGELISFEMYLTQPWVPRRNALEWDDRATSKANKDSKATTRLERKESGVLASNPGNSQRIDLGVTTPARIPQSSRNSCVETSCSVDSDTTIPKEFPKPHNETKLSSSTTLRSQTIPLHERSSNASAKCSPSPPKPPTQQRLKPDPTQRDPPSSLGPAISSLLAHHQRAASNSSNAPDRPLGRRRRQLLGRAPSNLSNRSFSRASSIDTMNTDGLGTPIEPSNQSALPSQDVNGKPSTTKPNESKDPFATLKAYAEEAEQAESREGPEVQLTQLSYEDPRVKAWRDRVVRKMGGGDELEETSHRKTTASVVEDAPFGTTKGIAGRTRAAGK
ncbi:MAG: hypothetical protein Q9195_002368 [Heterodermia aff. obscurata]